jgi:hypothetical protein
LARTRYDDLSAQPLPACYTISSCFLDLEKSQFYRCIAIHAALFRAIVCLSKLAKSPPPEAFWPFELQFVGFSNGKKICSALVHQGSSYYYLKKKERKEEEKTGKMGAQGGKKREKRRGPRVTHYH